MIATLLKLKQNNFHQFKIKDDYSIHRLVYDLFEDVRSSEQKRQGMISGIQYVDQGVRNGCRQILIVSNRPPRHQPIQSMRSQEIPETFLQQPCYQFEVLASPSKRLKATKKLVPIRAPEEIRDWFIHRSQKQWGFTVDEHRLSIHVHEFSRFSRQVRHSGKKTTQSIEQLTLNRASIRGILTVSDADLFADTFKKGIGRGRAFGLGLLQLVPITLH